MVKWINVALDDPEYFKFKEICEKNNLKMTAVLRELIRKYYRGEIKL